MGRLQSHATAALFAVMFASAIYACSAEPNQVAPRATTTQPVSGSMAASPTNPANPANIAGAAAPILPPPTETTTVQVPPKVAADGGAPVTMTATPAGRETPGQGCAATSVTAPPPVIPKVDIVWVVDASPSMLDDQRKIAASLAQFADKISTAHLDVQIVMLTTSPAIPVICPEFAPDPLHGSKLDGDPRYFFLDTFVDSETPLDDAVANYPKYASKLRPDAALHFVFVTDDESTYKGQTSPAQRAQSFYADMKALAGKDFTQHTISSEGPTACIDDVCMPDEDTGLCAIVMLVCFAANPGTTYYTLADMTKGLTASICQSDWTPIFDRLSQAVIASAPLPCSYPIPAPPAGQILDPTKVNVNWLAPGQSAEQLFRKAAERGACAEQLGWYYDDPMKPKAVLLCPTSCGDVAAGGTLNIAFGCATVELPLPS